MVIELKVYTHVLKLYNCTVNMNCKKFVDFFVTTVCIATCTLVHVVLYAHTL